MIDVVHVDEILLNIGSIDFLSIDVEGLDLIILKAIDFERFKPKLVCIEVNDEDTLNEALNYLIEQGYAQTSKIGCNLFAWIDSDKSREQI